MEKVLELLQQAQSVVISGHLRADGDCMGTESALYYLCKTLGKEVRIINPDQPDGRYQRLEKEAPFEVWNPDEDFPVHDLFIVCDCSVPSRLGEMAEAVQAIASKRVVVDHHPLTDEDAKYWDAMVHDSNAAASGVLAMRIARAMEVVLPMPALEACFVAIATDTGWFKYSNANAEAWSCAAELVESGVVPDVLYRAIYQQSDLLHSRGVAAALAKAENFSQGRAMISWMSNEDLEVAGGTLDDSDDVLDIMRSAGQVEVIAFVYERESGGVKASLRSDECVDVSAIAAQLGGGGHQRASGITFPHGMSLSEATSKLRSAMEIACDESKP